jgi:hypothetical protein
VAFLAILGALLPSSAPPGVGAASTTYQAESASTNLPTETLWPGFHGSSYLCCWRTQGQFATFTFSVPAGSTDLALRYSAGAGVATRKLEIDGAVTVANQTFTSTGNWNTWAANTITRTLTAGTHTFRVWFDSAAGSSQYINLDELVVTSSAPSAPPVNTAVPVVSGSALVGQTLSTTNGSWTNSPTAFAYVWQRCDGAGANCGPIAGATAATYVLAAADVGATVRVLVTASNAAGPGAPAASAVSALVANPPVPVNTALPVVSGPPNLGQSLSTTNGTWTNSPTAFAFEWQRCDSAGANCSPISGASNPTYTTVGADVGGTLRAAVTASNAGGPGLAAVSAATPVITAAPPPIVNTGLPVVTGTTTQGQSLTTSNGTWTGGPTSFTYQWQRCNGAGASCSPIGSATNAAYTLVAADVGATIRSTVTAAHNLGSASATSAQTAVVAAAPPGPVNTVAPSISGTAARSSQLTINPGTWTGSPSFTYQWLRCDGPTGSSCVQLVNATGTTYTAMVGDLNQRLRVDVRATNAQGTITVRSLATAVIANGPPAGPSAVYSNQPVILGTARVGQTLLAASGEFTELPTILWQWRRCSATTSSCSNIAGATTDHYTVTTADTGFRLQLQVRAQNALGTSGTTSSDTTGVVVAGPPAGSRRFGAPATESTLIRTFGNGTKVASVFAVGEAGSAVALSFYAHWISGQQTFTGAIYNVDATGQPTTLVASGGSVTLGGPEPEGFSTVSLPSVPLTTGSYALALVVSGTGAVILGADPVPGAIVTAANAGSTPTASWGAASTATGRMSFFVDYLPSSPPVPPAPVAGTPSVTGTATQGQVLTAVPGSWTGATDLGFQWQECDSGGGACADIPGARSATYRLTGAEVGSTVRVVVTGVGPGGTTPASSGATALVAAGPSGALGVSVAYAANATLPSPWQGSPGVTYVGHSPSCCVSFNGSTWDGGALRLTNPSASAITVQSVTVDVGTTSYSRWNSNLTIPAGGTLILTATSAFNFDTSDWRGYGCFDPLPVYPIIHVTMGGVTTDYRDTQRILNTGGRDAAACWYGNYNQFIEEGHDWVVVS